MKLLNLSSLTVATDRRVKIGEVTHVVAPLKVVDFIRITQAAEELEKAHKEGESIALRELELLLDVILSTMATTSKEELLELSLQELHQVANFIKGIDVEGVTIEGLEEQPEVDGEGK